MQNSVSVRSTLRVSEQNGVSLLHIMLEIHHSGREPLICDAEEEWMVILSFCQIV